MSWNTLKRCQLDAIESLKDGNILCGGVGSGKSITSLGYYYKEMGGNLYSNKYTKMRSPLDLYIITTAQKRDNFEWCLELNNYLMSVNEELSLYSNKIVIDSWNNITKYTKVTKSFFIFDEQHACGTGIWAKSFLKISRQNRWILLSATPGDNWIDYAYVFIANGFYRNKQHFEDEHVKFSRFSKYKRIERYYNEGLLQKYKNQILVDIDLKRNVIYHDEDIICDYDVTKYRTLSKERWNIWENRPMKSASELCYCLRKISYADESREVKLLQIFENHNKVIIFYNFDYELEILKSIYFGKDVGVAEWNGHKHEPIPKTNSWVYLVQYTSGSEGWNCIETDTIIFYSQTYSYKTLAQAKGRIDRMNTPFTDLYYYHLRSRSVIELSIYQALKKKKKFNETKFINKKI